MSIIDYMRKQMMIRRPFLYLLTAALAFLIGSIGMYALEHQKVTKLREQVTETQQTLIRASMEYEKRLSDRSKTIKIVNADGSSREETINDIAMNEAGQFILDSSTLSQKLNLTEYKINSGYTMNLLWFPSVTNPSYTKMIGFSASKEMLWGLGLGPVITYDIVDNQFWLGVNLSYTF